MGINPITRYSRVSFSRFCTAKNGIIIKLSIAYKCSKVHREESLIDPSL